MKSRRGVDERRRDEQEITKRRREVETMRRPNQ